jgi:oligopeptidase B
MKKNDTYSQSFKALFRNLLPFVKPYKGMIAGTLLLTLIGSFAAQVNPLLVNETINRVEELLRQPDPIVNGMRLLLIISAIMLANELLNIGIQFGQKYFGEKIRIQVGSDLSQKAVDRLLTYKMSFFAESDNQTGYLETRINRGVESLNSMIYEVPLTGYEDKSTWKVFLPHDDDARLEGIDIVKDYISVELRREGLTEIIVMSLNGGDTKKIVFPEPVYSASMGGNPEYEATTIRYTYTSLNRPTTLYEYNILTGESIKLKEQEVPSGFNPDDYTVERLWATAPDGVLVPMAIVYKNGLKKDGSNPALIYSYGSYGYSTDVHFSASMYSLIDRGFVYAIAQIRGGSDLGEQWYEDGKLLNKKNTFTDFIACSEKLINDGYTSSDKLAAMGGSAGGLLMGAVSNMRPDLYQTIVAQVPFVDVINTMLDDTLPLTTGEYEEWGNPNEEEYYNYILSYSPYDNISAQDYPNILVTGGINDSQVLFHEPAKYTAKLRALKTDNNILILKMNMESGHGGATGRYEGIKETAFDFAFILNRVGIYK